VRKNTGKTQVDKAIEDFILIPAVVLIGIYVTSALIDSMLQLNNETFRAIFTGVGGIAFFIYYFKKKMAGL
jgi:hypothetical protein